MLTRTVRIQVTAFVVMALLLVSYVAVRYVGILRYVGASGYTVKLELPQAGGIFTNAEVTYRGVSIGRVGDMHLTSKGIEANLDITSGRKIPTKLHASVADLSVIGEQYVDLMPSGTGGPYLHNGSVIHRSQTSLPPPVQTLLLSGDQLLKSVPIASLQTVVNQVYKATQGVAPDLQTLLQTNKSLFTTANDYLPSTTTLINNSKTVLATQNQESSAIKDFSSNIALIGSQLKASNGDISKVLSRATPAVKQVTGLIDDIHGSFRTLLSNLLTTSVVFLAQKNGVRELLVKLPVAIGVGGSVITPQGLNVGLVPTFFNPLGCTSGYGGTKVRSGLDTSGNPALNTSATCTAPISSGKDVRGTQNAP